MRQELDQIGGNVPEDIAVHRQRIEALHVTWSHSIKYAETRPGDRSDCMVHALEIPIGLVNVATTMNIQLDL